MELDLDAIEARHWHDESMRMCSLCMFEWPCDAVRMVAEVRRLRDVETLAGEALAELDAQPELAHPDAVWYTGAALRDALEADRG